jgi:DNA-binding MarR family transcriptional regulator
MDTATSTSARPAWLDDDQQRVWRNLLAVHARVVDRLDDELQVAHGLALADYDVLVQLSEAPESSLRMSDLATRLQLSPSGLTRRVDSLSRRDLVVRRACSSDGRGSFAVLTPAGRALLEEAAPTHVAGVRTYVIDTLPGPSLERLAAGLAAIEAALDRARPPTGA